VEQVPGALLPATDSEDGGPVLDRSTRAGQLPWRLPAEPGQSGVAADAATLGDLEVRAASVVGPDHRCDEPAKPRQDAYAVARTTSGDQLIVAVADGLSSSRRSDIGARVAASAAARELRRALDDGVPAERLDPVLVFRSVAGEMLGTGRSRGWPDEDICAVLIVAVVPAVAERGGARSVWTAQIGDVSLWLHHGDHWEQESGVAKSASELDRNVLPAVLPYDPSDVLARVLRVEAGQAVALMTDGMGDALTDVAGAQDYFTRRWAAPSVISHFLADLCFDAPGQLDDRTAVVVWCGPPNGAGSPPSPPSGGSEVRG